ncbi:DEAD/DEAH box helicase [Aerosakkonema funiforme]|uniref:DEAD/DEAH box helicase n=1 Tax=Aerosakkonema funiforme TaxID=1246630 RepID=UPI0035B9A1E4
MALIVPDSLPSGISQGEKNLSKLLSEKLSNEFYIWYQPNTKYFLPHFTILAPNFGLLIIQIASCYPKDIINVDNDKFTLASQIQKSKKIESHQSSPEISAKRIRQRSHLSSETTRFQQLGIKKEKTYIDKLEEYHILTYANGKSSNKLSFPVAVAIVMSNITATQAREKNIYSQLSEPKTVYREEFLSWDKFSEEDLLNRLERMFAVRFPFPTLTPDQIETIKGIIYPEIAIKKVPASRNSVPDVVELPNNSYVIKTLDYRQECIAKSIGEGHRIIYGVAGSGKTLILLCRAKFLAIQNPKQRILILCFNISLAAYLKSILHGDSDNPHFQNIEVRHFHGWANSLVKKLPLRLAGLSADDCDELVGTKILKYLNKQPLSRKWDAVLVDEAQTFFVSWLKCCVAALKDRDNGNLMIVADGNQSLYKRRNFTWNSVGIKAVGRTSNKRFALDKNYRNTEQILASAWSLVSHISDIKSPNVVDNTEDAELIFPLIQPQAAMRQGECPILHIKQTEYQEMEAAIAEIINLHQLGYSSSDIAVLYRMADDNKRLMLSALKNQLQGQGLPIYWVTESRDSEKMYSANNPGVRIMSTLNALGLEFKVVLILWVQDWEFTIPATLEADVATCRRLYVAMTRAQDILHVFGSGNSGLLTQLQGNGTFEIKVN